MVATIFHLGRSVGLLGWFYDQLFDPIVKLWVENWATDQGAAKGPPAGVIKSLDQFAATTVVPMAVVLDGTRFGIGFFAGGANLLSLQISFATQNQSFSFVKRNVDSDARLRLRQFVLVELSDRAQNI